MITWFAQILGKIMNLIYSFSNNYGITILLFTILSKIILFPINIFIQKNSIKMLKIKPKIEEIKYQYAEDKEKLMEEQIALFEKEKYKPSIGVIPLLIQIPIILALVKVIENSTNYIPNINNMIFLGMDLSKIPTIKQYIIMPIMAAISSILLCYFQNRENVLQKAESLKSKLFTGTLTTAVTVYFVFIVPNGVGLYWIIGNILAILQLYILNFIYPPKKYVDYAELEKWKKLNEDKQKEIRQNKKREKVDYKKFFDNVDKIKLVFYSEKSGFYKYFSGIIKYILENTELEIYYITSDPKDAIFNKNEKNLHPYYVGKNKLIPLFMKMEADIVVMTTPDLQKYYLKRSIVKKDVEYIYMDHSTSSYNLTLRTGALDYYDTIFATGFNQLEELNEMKKIRQMQLKNIIEVGFPLLDDLMISYDKIKDNTNKKKTILIAPSYQEDNILESCLEEILENLLKTDFKIIVRPHPQFIQRQKEKINELLKKYEEKFNDSFYFELDFSSNETIYTADLIITDWSGIAFEYSFTTTKPTLFINTKMKVVNKEYKKIPVVPMEIELRNKIGKSIEKEEISNINLVVEDLIKNKEKYEQNNIAIRNKYIYNLGSSGKVGAEYIINQLLQSKKGTNQK